MTDMIRHLLCLVQEMVFIDLDINSWSFWVILFFDVTMLIARDADLWEDLARVIHKAYGKCGGLVLIAMQLLGGDGDDIGDSMTKGMDERAKTRFRAVSQAAGFQASEFSAANDPEQNPMVRAAVHRQ
jgi:hypothetical protein